MVYLCLDLGERRIGLAVSDPTGMLARPVGTIPGGGEPADIADRVRPAIDEHGASELVVGLPVRLDGEMGPEAQRAADIAEVLRHRLQIPVHLWDERLSSVEATRRMIEAGVRRRRRKQVVDQLAATLILQGFLDARGIEAAFSE